MTEPTTELAPSNVKFERRALGAALRYPETLETLATQLTINDFLLTAHKDVFAALVHAHEEQLDLDVPLLAAKLSREGKGGDNPQTLIGEMWADAATVAVTPQYIEELRAYSNARTITRAAQSMTVQALEAQGDTQALVSTLSQARDALDGITETVVPAPWQQMATLAEEAQNEDAQGPTVFTGFTDLDRALQGGLRPGQLVTLAGRPGQGKSTLALDICRESSVKRGIPGLYLSFEMSGTEIATRYLSAEGSVDMGNLQRNEVAEQDKAILEGVIERTAKSPLYVMDKVEPNVDSILAATITAHRRLGIQYVVWDYAQLVSGPSGMPREQVVSEASRRMKALALSLEITVLMVAQLNRGPEQRNDKTPQVSDLRESGQIEQDSDVVMLLFQPGVYDPLSERAGEADVIIGKQRNGPTGIATLAFQGQYARFVNLAREFQIADEGSDFMDTGGESGFPAPGSGVSWADPTPQA